MKALIYEQHGGPEVLQYRTVPDPESGPRDAVIKVALTTINRLDAVQRNGWFTVPGFSLPHISGMDVAGEVVETRGAGHPGETGRPGVGEPLHGRSAGRLKAGRYG